MDLIIDEHTEPIGITKTIYIWTINWDYVFIELIW